VGLYTRPCSGYVYGAVLTLLGITERSDAMMPVQIYRSSSTDETGSLGRHESFMSACNMQLCSGRIDVMTRSHGTIIGRSEQCRANLVFFAKENVTYINPVKTERNLNYI